jgi:hypothetical protein
MDLHFHSLICLHGVFQNRLSIGTNLLSLIRCYFINSVTDTAWKNYVGPCASLLHRCRCFNNIFWSTEKIRSPDLSLSKRRNDWIIRTFFLMGYKAVYAIEGGGICRLHIQDLRMIQAKNSARSRDLLATCFMLIWCLVYFLKPKCRRYVSPKS